MPMYEFVCGKCGFKFENLSKPDTTSQTCPKCGGKGKKVMSVTGRPVIK